MTQLSLFPNDELDSGAVFSECRKYRYVLWRRWNIDSPENMIAFIGLNPSTADETLNDPTITRLIGFAKDWGYSGMYMLNAFAWRDTDPSGMKSAEEPVGKHNDEYIVNYGGVASQLVACWGNHGVFKDRARHIENLLKENSIRYWVFKRTIVGQPIHPLYLPKSIKLTPG